MMGVEWADCPMVAEMVGMKFFTNEFVAYQQLSQYKNKRLSGVEEWIEGKKQWISVSASLEKHKQSVDRYKVLPKSLSHTHRSLSRVPGLTLGRDRVKAESDPKQESNSVLSFCAWAALRSFPLLPTPLHTDPASLIDFIGSEDFDKNTGQETRVVFMSLSL